MASQGSGHAPSVLRAQGLGSVPALPQRPCAVLPPGWVYWEGADVELSCWLWVSQQVPIVSLQHLAL